MQASVQRMIERLPAEDARNLFVLESLRWMKRDNITMLERSHGRVSRIVYGCGADHRGPTLPVLSCPLLPDFTAPPVRRRVMWEHLDVVAAVIADACGHSDVRATDLDVHVRERFVRPIRNRVEAQALIHFIRTTAGDDDVRVTARYDQRKPVIHVGDPAVARTLTQSLVDVDWDAVLDGLKVEPTTVAWSVDVTPAGVTIASTT